MSSIFKFPLKQHIGNKAVPCVVEGDEVRRGQPVALQGEGLGSNLFSSVSGTVIAVDEDSIVVEQNTEPDAGFVPLTGTTTAELVKEAGIVGLGGAGFPTLSLIHI